MKQIRVTYSPGIIQQRHVQEWPHVVAWEAEPRVWYTRYHDEVWCLWYDLTAAYICLITRFSPNDPRTDVYQEFASDQPRRKAREILNDLPTYVVRLLL